MPRRKITRKGRGRKRLLFGLATLLVVTLIGINLWLALSPASIRKQLDQQLSAYLAVPYSMAEVEFSLLDGLTIRDLQIQAPAGSRNPEVFQVAKIQIKLDRWALLSGSLVLKEIIIQKPKVHLELDEQAQLTLARLAKARQPKSDSSLEFKLPAIVVESLEFTTCPDSIYNLEEPVRVQRFELKLQDGDGYSISGVAIHPFFRRIQLSGQSKLAEHRFEGRLDLLRMNFDDRFVKNLPPRWRLLWQEINPQGIASAQLNFQLLGASLSNWSAEIELRNGSMELADPPITLNAVSGRLRILPEPQLDPTGKTPHSNLTPARVTIIQPLRGRAWGGDATLTGDIELAETTISKHNLHLSLDSLTLGNQVRRLLSSSGFDFFENRSLAGRVSLALEITGDSTQVYHLRRVNLDDVTLILPKLGFKLTDTHGLMESDAAGKEYTVDVRFIVAGCKGRLTGRGHFLKEQAFQLRCELQELAVDSPLLEALPAEFLLQHRQYQATGKANLVATLTRQAGKQTAGLEVVTELLDTSIYHEHFPYSLNQIRGEIKFNANLNLDSFSLSPKAMTFTNFSGRHHQSIAKLDLGHIKFVESKSEGHTSWTTQYDFPIYSPALEIDGDIIQALPESTANLIRSFGAEGKLFTSVHLYNSKDSSLLDMTIKTRIDQPLTVRYAPLPYPMTFTRGETKFDFSKQSIEFRGFITDPALGPRITLSGSHKPKPDASEQLLHLDIRIGPGENVKGIALHDPEFHQALPADLQDLIIGLKAEGHVTGSLTVDYSFASSLNEVGAYSIGYHGRAKVIDAKAEVGVQLSEINSAVEIQGEASSDPKKPHYFNANIIDGDFRFNRFFIQDADAELSFGREHALIRATRNNPEGKDSRRPNQSFVNRLSPQQVRNCLQISINKSDLYGGDLWGFFFVDTARKDFMGHFTTYDLDLDKGTKDLFGENSNSKGLVEGEVLFSGDLDRPKSLSGRGSFDITQAQLTQLPITQTFLTHTVFGLFTLVPSQRVVNEVHCRFDIADRRFWIRKFEDFTLMAPTARAAGKGWMDFDTLLKIRLENRGSLNGVPVIGPTFDRWTGVTLEGPLEDLQEKMQ